MEQFTTDHLRLGLFICQRALHHVDDLEQEIAAIATALAENEILLLYEFCWVCWMSPSGCWLHHHSRRLSLGGAVRPCEFARLWRAEHQHLATSAQLPQTSTAVREPGLA